jgi:hypothetical protein
MPQRNYSKEQSEVSNANPRVIVPMSYAQYQDMCLTAQHFRSGLDRMIADYPKLFPEKIEQGYTLHDSLPASAKLPDVRFRRIKLKAKDDSGKQQVLTICTSDVMPYYMTGFTDEVEKALFLRRFGVPFWALTYVFGHNDDYGYNMAGRFGRYEIVDTVVQNADCLPEDLVADEKHVHFNGEKGYISTTVGADCVLGASLALAADEEALTLSRGLLVVTESAGDFPALKPQEQAQLTRFVA